LESSAETSISLVRRRLLGKGRRERRVYLTNDWITRLTASYLEARDALPPTHPYLLFNLHYAPLPLLP
jgi:site-specific recombinase XerD